jgi:flavin reductase (DIM6/NTAB) family NADH-FMN oxidoreductase RutF
VTHPTISIDPDDLEGRDPYRLLISVIIPRPIGWVSTLGSDGSLNLAPYSFFNGVSGSPPTVMFSVGQRAGQPKDTLRNIKETGECVINLADRALAERMVRTAGEWEYGINEFDMAELETAPSDLVKPPRVAAAPIAMEARLLQLVPVPDTTNTIVLARVIRFQIREGLLLPKGTVDPVEFDPIARLGRADYTTLGEVMTIFRPKV